jgi:ribonuclease BN (tRNA processing enzyme)
LFGRLFYRLCLRPFCYELQPHDVVGDPSSAVFHGEHLSVYAARVIGQIAHEAHVKRLVLSHRMLRTLGKEEQSQAEISKNFSGPVTSANDLDCFPVP